jgi:hypothetical protein
MSDRRGASLALIQQATAQRMPGHSMAICNYCLNRNTYECESECQSEGKYRYLEPEPLPQWEMPPQVPSFRVLVDMPAADVLATIWLHAYYLEPHNDPR